MSGVSTLTTGSIDGTGTFDVIASVLTKHLDAQYVKNRIKGSEYAKVYSETITAVLAQSINYDLQAQQARRKEALLDKQIEEQTIVNSKLPDKLQCEIDVCTQNKLKLVEETKNVVATTALTNVKDDMVVAQIEQVNAETANTKLEKNRLNIEISHLDEQLTLNNDLLKIQKDSETLKLAQLPTRLQLEIDKLGLEKDVIGLQKQKLAIEVLYMDDRFKLENDKLDLEKQKLEFEIATFASKLQLELDVLGLQKDKLSIEKQHLGDKLTTEIALESNKAALVASQNILETIKISKESDRLQAEIDKSLAEIAKVEKESAILAVKKDKETLELAQLPTRLQLEIDTLQLNKDKLDIDKQKLTFELAKYEDRIALELTKLGAETDKVVAEAALVTAQKDMTLLKLSLEPQRLQLEIDKLNAEKDRIANESLRINAEKLRISAQITQITKEVSRYDEVINSKLKAEKERTQLDTIKQRLVCYQVEVEKFQKEVLIWNINLYRTQARGIKGNMKLDLLKTNSNLLSSVTIADTGVEPPAGLDFPSLVGLSQSIESYVDGINTDESVGFTNQTGCDALQYNPDA